MASTESGKDLEKCTYCEYAKAATGLGEFELSIRECGDLTCPQSIFSDPSLYEKCPYRLQYIKDGVSANRTETKKVFVRIRPKQEIVPKFTGVSCNGCQYKAGSYCWSQCTFNIWKRKPDW